MVDAPIVFMVPGPIEQRTGGYGYDRRIVQELRQSSRTVRVVELDGAFPICCDIARASAASAIAAMPDGATIVIDGLVLPGVAPSLPGHTARLTTVILVHHPLALESGLSAAESTALLKIECASMPQADGIVTTSEATVALLADYGIEREKVSTVCPGTDPAPQARGSTGEFVQLLCVGSVVPRKGHRVLIDALSDCAELPWRLLCLGSKARDSETVAAIERQIAASDLADRVALAGEADETALGEAYAAADVFVLASALEGYGMAFAEALARGLPIVGSGEGAVRDTVPEDAGLIVPVGDRPALANALACVIESSELRRRLSNGARAAGLKLPDWVSAGREFTAALDRAAAR